MNLFGALIGGFLGWTFFGSFGLVMGVILGARYNTGRTRRFNAFNFQRATGAQKIFFEATFRVMGYLAKSDGRVTEKEIQMARQVMARLTLSEDQCREAMLLFNEGKQPGFDYRPEVMKLRQACMLQPLLLELFAQIQMQFAAADGMGSPQKQAAMKSIFETLGVFGGFRQPGAGAGWGYQGGGYQQRARPSHTTTVAEAYRILDVSSSASDQEIKRAYRRQMSQNHPDKLMSKGLSEAMIKIATEKTQQIKAAYDQICEVRGTKATTA